MTMNNQSGQKFPCLYFSQTRTYYKGKKKSIVGPVLFLRAQPAVILDLEER